nr:hypothetical protein [Streptosporangium amethystogenes]
MACQDRALRVSGSGEHAGAGLEGGVDPPGRHRQQRRQAGIAGQEFALRGEPAGDGHVALVVGLSLRPYGQGRRHQGDGEECGQEDGEGLAAPDGAGLSPGGSVEELGLQPVQYEMPMACGDPEQGLFQASAAEYVSRSPAVGLPRLCGLPDPLMGGQAVALGVEPAAQPRPGPQHRGPDEGDPPIGMSDHVTESHEQVVQRSLLRGVSPSKSSACEIVRGERSPSSATVTRRRKTSGTRSRSSGAREA